MMLSAYLPEIFAQNENPKIPSSTYFTLYVVVRPLNITVILENQYKLQFLRKSCKRLGERKKESWKLG